MASDEELREALRKTAVMYAPDSSVLAQIKSVNEKECTCVLVDDDGQEFFNVRLRPVTGKNKSFLQIPKAGSFVLAVRVEDSGDWMVVACDEVEKVQLIVGNSEIIVTEDDILMNGGKLGGLIKISELTAKLNELVQIYNTHTHAGNGVTTTMLASLFNKGDYEDETVKH
ncbi:MAG: hypothetical protein ACK5KN_16630 [Dysgonomonas sp.]|uniref:hypothetical protein n=1 Tax=Dysgonomonas sp. TaxID=1891233 RepID=UPI003A8B9458